MRSCGQQGCGQQQSCGQTLPAAPACARPSQAHFRSLPFNTRGILALLSATRAKTLFLHFTHFTCLPPQALQVPPRSCSPHTRVFPDMAGGDLQHHLPSRAPSSRPHPLSRLILSLSRLIPSPAPPPPLHSPSLTPGNKPHHQLGPLPLPYAH